MKKEVNYSDEVFSASIGLQQKKLIDAAAPQISLKLKEIMDAIDSIFSKENMETDFDTDRQIHELVSDRLKVFHLQMKSDGMREEFLSTYKVGRDKSCILPGFGKVVVELGQPASMFANVSFGVQMLCCGLREGVYKQKEKDIKNIYQSLSNVHELLYPIRSS